MTDMLKRATAAVLPIINSDQAHIVAAKSARAALLAALDPDDKALAAYIGREVNAVVSGRTVLLVLRAYIAHGESNGNG